MSAELPLKTGGPAFPNYPTDDQKHGLSILDWFAGHIMAGLAANSEVVNQAFIQALLQPTPTPNEAEPVPLTPENLSLIAFVIAAQMIDLREQIPIDPTPVPVPPSEEQPPDLVMPPDSLLPGDSVQVGDVKVGGAKA